LRTVNMKCSGCATAPTFPTLRPGNRRSGRASQCRKCFGGRWLAKLQTGFANVDDRQRAATLNASGVCLALRPVRRLCKGSKPDESLHRDGALTGRQLSRFVFSLIDSLCRTQRGVRPSRPTCLQRLYGGIRDDRYSTAHEAAAKAASLRRHYTPASVTENVVRLGSPYRCDREFSE
jgi:hypothetical protein